MKPTYTKHTVFFDNSFWFLKFYFERLHLYWKPINLDFLDNGKIRIIYIKIKNAPNIEGSVPEIIWKILKFSNFKNNTNYII
jgi:hypothetical protein